MVCPLKSTSIEDSGLSAFDEKPLFFITSHKRWYDLDSKEMWQRRGLLWLLILRSIQLKYRQTLFGVVWTIIQPVAPMLVFSFVFYKYFSFSEDKISYPIFIYSGMIPWIYLSNAINLAGNSLSSQTYLLGKIYFPRFMLPLSVVLSGALDFFIGCIVLFGVIIFSGGKLHLTLLWIPFLFFLLAWLALSVGILFASLSIIYRDIRNILPYFLQMLLFLTPVVYPSNAISERWMWVLKLNPLTGIVESFRATLFGNTLIWNEILGTIIFTTLLTFFSIIIFVRMEKHIADYL